VPYLARLGNSNWAAIGEVYWRPRPLQALEAIRKQANEYPKATAICTWPLLWVWESISDVCFLRYRMETRVSKSHSAKKNVNSIGLWWTKWPKV